MIDERRPHPVPDVRAADAAAPDGLDVCVRLAAPAPVAEAVAALRADARLRALSEPEWAAVTDVVMALLMGDTERRRDGDHTP